METNQRTNLWIETKTFLIATKNWVGEMWLLFIMTLRLRMASKLADMKHYITDKRYYVYPDVRSGGLLVINNDEIKIKRKQGFINRHEDHLRIMQKAFHVTPLKRNGADAPTREQKYEMRQRYIRWQKTLKPLLKRAKVGIPTTRKR